jgi:hypothetical protein
MYKMMDDKLKFYAENENSMLNSVKTTIFNAYEKSESLADMNKKEKYELNEKIEKLQNELKLKNQEVASLKENFDGRINSLNADLSLKTR